MLKYKKGEEVTPYCNSTVGVGDEDPYELLVSLKISRKPETEEAKKELLERIEQSWCVVSGVLKDMEIDEKENT